MILASIHGARAQSPNDLKLSDRRSGRGTCQRAERWRWRVARARPRQPARAAHPGSKRLLTTVNPLQKWGLSVALRRGTNKAAVAIARKLTVAIWHVLQGHWNKALEETTTLLTKLAKLATELGVSTLQELGYASKVAFQEQKLEVLRTYP
jgi:hypothetical protein